MKVIVHIATVLILSLVGFTTESYSHMSKELLQCQVFSQVRPTGTPKLMNEVVAESSGLVAEIYDVTGDGGADVAIYSPLLGGFEEDGALLHKDEPLFYEIDLNGDHNPDVIYINPYGTNTCDSLVLYKVIDGKPVRGGLINWSEVRDDLKYDGRPLE